MTIADKKAYTEVYEVLKHISQEELNKIPSHVINFLECNRDKTYIFTYDVSQSLKEQKISRKANSIIILLFKRYFATEVQREKINNILRQNELIYQRELEEKYKSDDIFKKNNMEKTKSENVAMVKYKESILKKIINKIISFYKKS